MLFSFFCIIFFFGVVWQMISEAILLENEIWNRENLILIQYVNNDTECSVYIQAEYELEAN
jgi:hypothetical protein